MSCFEWRSEKPEPEQPIRELYFFNPNIFAKSSTLGMNSVSINHLNLKYRRFTTSRCKDKKENLSLWQSLDFFMVKSNEKEVTNRAVFKSNSLVTNLYYLAKTINQWLDYFCKSDSRICSNCLFLHF